MGTQLSDKELSRLQAAEESPDHEALEAAIECEIENQNPTPGDIHEAVGVVAENHGPDFMIHIMTAHLGLSVNNLFGEVVDQVAEAKVAIMAEAEIQKAKRIRRSMS